jgi:hypothetical protein
LASKRSSDDRDANPAKMQKLSPELSEPPVRSTKPLSSVFDEGEAAAGGGLQLSQEDKDLELAIRLSQVPVIQI